MSVHLKRLYSDFYRLNAALEEQPFIRLKEYFNDPPDRYIFEYRIKSIESVNEKINFTDHHLVEILLPKNYPHEMPVCRMKTKIFHPNIDAHAICIADYWVASESLVNLVIRIGEIIAYQSYYIKSPLDAVAAKWCEENLDLLPIDSIDLTPFTDPADIEVILPGAFDETENQERKETQHCSNCKNELNPGNTETCQNGHVVCRECTTLCSGCKNTICVKCHLQKCHSCNRHFCENCISQCSLCKDYFCVEDFISESGVCHTCNQRATNPGSGNLQANHKYCPDCGARNEDYARYCSACGKKMFA